MFPMTWRLCCRFINMKKNMKYITLLLFIAIVGCGEPQKIENAESSSAGTLPDGRIVKYIKRNMGAGVVHYIYYVENPDGGYSVSVNEPKGKGRQTIVEIDGIRYVPAEK